MGTIHFDFGFVVLEGGAPHDELVFTLFTAWNWTELNGLFFKIPLAMFRSLE